MDESTSSVPSGLKTSGQLELVQLDLVQLDLAQLDLLIFVVRYLRGAELWSRVGRSLEKKGKSECHEINGKLHKLMNELATSD
jgi:hypothetical protein